MLKARVFPNYKNMIRIIHFCIVLTANTLLDDSNVQLPPFQSGCENSLSTIRCTASEIETLIKLLNPNKATGPDAISNRMLKFPQIFKESNVIPLPKKGDNSCPSNFRPISLLSGVGKIQERIVLKKHS